MQMPPTPTPAPLGRPLSPNCSLCKILSHHRIRSGAHIVWGLGPLSSPLFILGESPGSIEADTGRPFHPNAPTGRELVRLVRHVAGTRMSMCYLTNVVKCNPPGNRAATETETAACSKWLRHELSNATPIVIATLGRAATQALLGPVDMEVVHGIAHPYTTPSGHTCVVVPCYHPAAGLHAPTLFLQVQHDFLVVGQALRRQNLPLPPVDHHAGHEDYSVATSPDDLAAYLSKHPVMAVDTESLHDGTTWGLSISNRPGTSRVVLADNRPCLDVVRRALGRHRTDTIFHNALHDLPILADMGIHPHPTTTYDTMVAAYLLGDEPQGLKPLAARYAGMTMASYTDLVSPATISNALAYYIHAASHTWGKPEPVLVPAPPPAFWRLKQPQSMDRKLARILSDLDTGKLLLEDLYARWHRIAPEEGRAQVEAALGPMLPGDLSDIPMSVATRYSARDADATLRIFPYLWDRLASMDLLNTFRRDMAALPMVVDMALTGMPCNPEGLLSLSPMFEEKAADLENQIAACTGLHINPASPKQVSHLLYDHLGLPQVKKTKTTGAASTADAVLAVLSSHHPAPGLIRDWRSITKLRTTYSEKLPEFVRPSTGRIHCTFRFTRTDTGRLSTADPNLMAIPKRSPEGRLIRRWFEAPPGYCFLCPDYSQIELRILAHVSEDPELISAFLSGVDLHTSTGAKMFGVDLDAVTKDQRSAAKCINFGIVYGISAPGLRLQLLAGGADPATWTEDTCDDLIHTWLDLYSGVRRYTNRTHAEARRHGYVRDMWGRIRHCPGIFSTNRNLRSEALRQAGNAPIQSGAQGVIKEAMGRLVPVLADFRSQGHDVRAVLQIHDDLPLLLPISSLDTVAPVVVDVMSNAVDLLVPTPVDPDVGVNWGELEGWEPGWAGPAE